MQLVSTEQVHQSALQSIEFDIFLAASGFESRATNAMRFIALAAVKSKVAFGFEDRRNDQRDDNDRLFKSKGVTILEFHGNTCSQIADCVQQLISAVERSTIRIFVDYSSMTRSWYAGIISAIRSISSRVRIECYFGYSPAIFEPAQPTAPNESVSPIPGFGSLDAMDRPTALIVGLGYEKDRAIGLLEYLDPAVCFALMTDPVIDPGYQRSLMTNNHSFLAAIGRGNLFTHPLDDLQRTSQLLLSLVWGLKDDYRVILAPLGVKPFSLLCLLLAMKDPDLDVWRVTSGTKSGVQTRAAIGHLLVLRADFQHAG